MMISEVGHDLDQKKCVDFLTQLLLASPFSAANDFLNAQYRDKVLERLKFLQTKTNAGELVGVLSYVPESGGGVAQVLWCGTAPTVRGIAYSLYKQNIKYLLDAGYSVLYQVAYKGEAFTAAANRRLGFVLVAGLKGDPNSDVYKLLRENFRSD